MVVVTFVIVRWFIDRNATSKRTASLSPNDVVDCRLEARPATGTIITVSLLNLHAGLLRGKVTYGEQGTKAGLFLPSSKAQSAKKRLERSESAQGLRVNEEREIGWTSGN